MRGGTSTNNHHTNSSTIALPKSSAHNISEGGGVGGGGMQEVAGAQDTIYLCNFRVSVDGEWLCLKELQDLDIQEGGNISHNDDAGTIANFGIENNGGGSGGDYGGGGVGRARVKCDNTKIEREWVNYYSRDPAAIERSNLVNICKLVVKELLEQSLRFGRMLDSDHLPLQHFFIVLEHVLRNGLKPKKGLLGPRKELWDLLQSVEKYCIEAQDITASVRDLPTVKTQMGRARAWLRLALMQKKIADYLQALVEHKEDLAEYYEPHALMMSDEIVVIMGILVGLNVIDCNLCVKEEDLDSQQGIIDFSLYLRSSSRASPEDDVHNNEGNGAMTAVLDQKNYIEELNRHLNATVANLQAKVEALTTTNALQKEDLAIARNNILALQAENMAMRRNASNMQNNHHHNQSNQHHHQRHDDMNVFERIDTELAESLAEERKKKQEIEKELELQISLKAETEMAMKLLEKDIHEKQDTIISLRRQLEDIKSINLEMYKKLQECESSLKHKTDILSKLESQKETMANAICDLEKKFESETSHSVALQDTSQALSLQVLACEERAALAEAELRIEREWRHSLQEKEQKHKDDINNLQTNIKQLCDDARSHVKVKEELDKLRVQWNEAQKTLEELGIQLSVSKLQISDLKEQADYKPNLLDNTTGPTTAGGWKPDKMITQCKACNREFSMRRRKHHCRNCGEIFCHSCSEQVMPLPNTETGQLGKPVRVCDTCWENLAEKQSTR